MLAAPAASAKPAPETLPSHARRDALGSAAVEAGTECAALLQQLAALRGAANGLMAEVLDSHLRETFGATPGASPELEAEIGQLMRLVRSYLK